MAGMAIPGHYIVDVRRVHECLRHQNRVNECMGSLGKQDKLIVFSVFGEELNSVVEFQPICKLIIV